MSEAIKSIFAPDLDWLRLPQQMGPRLCWKLNYDPQSRVGSMIDWLMQSPEPVFPNTLYRLSSGQMCEFLDIDLDWHGQLSITCTAIFEKLTKRQREVILANLLDVLKMCNGMLSEPQTLCYIKSSFSARLNALIQRESYAGDFGQDEDIE